jgi:hypothetical protein
MGQIWGKSVTRHLPCADPDAKIENSFGSDPDLKNDF